MNGVSFSFAKRYGVLVTSVEDNKANIIYRGKPNLAIINELRRHLNIPLNLESVDDETFGRLLVKNYQTDSSIAMQMAEDMGESMDLFELIHELPKPEDLLEKQDDAPIIRLLNALLSEAIKEARL